MPTLYPKGDGGGSEIYISHPRTPQGGQVVLGFSPWAGAQGAPFVTRKLEV